LCLHDLNLGRIWRLFGLHADQRSQQCGCGGVLDYWYNNYLRGNGPGYGLHCSRGTAPTPPYGQVCASADGTLQWLLQAHLSTEDYSDAMNGLRRVRRFRYATLWIKYPLDLFVHLVTNTLNAFQLRGIRDRRRIMWTRAMTFKPSVGQAMVRLATDAQHLPFQEARSQEARSQESAVNNGIA
jgi:hypothetical protein